MKKTLLGGMVLIAIFLFSTVGLAVNIPIGFIAWDLTNPGYGAFDIINMSGANSSDPDFPMLTPINLSNLDLTITYTNGDIVNVAPGYFTPAPLDPMSFDGQDISIASGILPTTATLKGRYSPLSPVTLVDGTAGMINIQDFEATIPFKANGLEPLDFKIFEADFTPSIPEPGTWLLLGTGLVSLALLRRKKS
jgi:hypothetical protein